jgi:hypothetical protein
MNEASAVPTSRVCKVSITDGRNLRSKPRIWGSVPWLAARTRFREEGLIFTCNIEVCYCIRTVKQIERQRDREVQVCDKRKAYRFVW